MRVQPKVNPRSRSSNLASPWSSGVRCQAYSRANAAGEVLLLRSCSASLERIAVSKNELHLPFLWPDQPLPWSVGMRLI
jgi:hypothetical protein